MQYERTAFNFPSIKFKVCSCAINTLLLNLLTQCIVYSGYNGNLSISRSCGVGVKSIHLKSLIELLHILVKFL